MNMSKATKTSDLVRQGCIQKNCASRKRAVIDNEGNRLGAIKADLTTARRAARRGESWKHRHSPLRKGHFPPNYSIEPIGGPPENS